MIQVHTLIFNPFSENSYILSDETGECVIIDPGCSTSGEEQELVEFVQAKGLKPVKLLNTHCHIDHVFGNQFVADKWKLGLEIHESDVKVLLSFTAVCQMYGFPGGTQPEPAHFLAEGDHVSFGNSKLVVLFTPGHSPGSITFYCREQNFVISGDVLFQGSIGRTDLPGGDFDTLEKSIRTKLYTLPDDVTVFPGHGPSTTICWEKEHNAFVTA